MNYRLWITRAVARLFFVIALALVPSWLPVVALGNTQDPRPIRIGLDADMTVLQAGEAIRRGIVLAIDEINAAGGVHGRPLELVVRDNRGNPARGMDNIEDLAQLDNLVAVVGGMLTPVTLAQLETIHRHGIVYLVPWAAGTAVVDNGYDPNFVFRVSVRDEFAGGFLIDAALRRGFKRPGLLLWRTSWGRSNEVAMNAALERLGMAPAGIQWFNSGQRTMSAEIDALVASGADVVMLVANGPEGAAAIREMALRPAEDRLPIISHWGITGADVPQRLGAILDVVDLTFLQTFSFVDPENPELAARVYESYCARFGDCISPERVHSPVGTTQAYDLVHLLHRAIEQAGTADREQVRQALERLGPHRGLVRAYDPAFTAERHDALDAGDFRLFRFSEGGAIVPMTVP